MKKISATHRAIATLLGAIAGALTGPFTMYLTAHPMTGAYWIIGATSGAAAVHLVTGMIRIPAAAPAKKTPEEATR